MSNIPGSMKLMVTLEAATERATPARNAVSPARAPDDRSRPTSGIFTEPEVMLTMRPNFLATIGSIAFWISSIATIMLPMTPSIIFCRSSSRKSRNGGPALLFDQNVGLRAGGEQRLLAFRRGDIGHHRRDLGAGRLVQFGRGGGEAIFVEAVDHHLAAGFGEAVSAGAAEPAARRADDRLAARNPKVHA